MIYMRRVENLFGNSFLAFSFVVSRVTNGVLSAIPKPKVFGSKRPGQSTVEYLLMLAIVVGMTLAIGILFHKRILGGMFSLVGKVIGAGKPA